MNRVRPVLYKILMSAEIREFSKEEVGYFYLVTEKDPYYDERCFFIRYFWTHHYYSSNSFPQPSILVSREMYGVNVVEIVECSKGAVSCDLKISYIFMPWSDSKKPHHPAIEKTVLKPYSVSGTSLTYDEVATAIQRWWREIFYRPGERGFVLAKESFVNKIK